jgi:acetolactate synthase regulatory subunit
VVVVGRLDAPDLLVRVLGVLLRRRCTVVGVDFAAEDRHRHGRLVIVYDAPATHADRTLDWLRGLVDVNTVEPV